MEILRRWVCVSEYRMSGQEGNRNINSHYARYVWYPFSCLSQIPNGDLSHVGVFDQSSHPRPMVRECTRAARSSASRARESAASSRASVRAVVAGCGRLAAATLGRNDQAAIGGFDVDAVLVDAGQFQGDFVGLGGVDHLGGGHALGGLQLLLEATLAEELEDSSSEDTSTTGSTGRSRFFPPGPNALALT